MNKTNTREVFDILQDVNLFELLSRKELYSEYIEDSLENHFKDFLNEINELQEVLNNPEQCQNELRDIIYTFGLLLTKMNKEGLLRGFKGFGEIQKQKIFERAPNLKACEKVSREVENKTWYILKEKQND